MVNLAKIIDFRQFSLVIRAYAAMRKLKMYKENKHGQKGKHVVIFCGKLWY